MLRDEKRRSTTKQAMKDNKSRKVHWTCNEQVCIQINLRVWRGYFDSVNLLFYMLLHNVKTLFMIIESEIFSRNWIHIQRAWIQMEGRGRSWWKSSTTHRTKLLRAEARCSKRSVLVFRFVKSRICGGVLRKYLVIILGAHMLKPNICVLIISESTLKCFRRCLFMSASWINCFMGCKRKLLVIYCVRMGSARKYAAICAKSSSCVSQLFNRVKWNGFKKVRWQKTIVRNYLHCWAMIEAKYLMSHRETNLLIAESLECERLLHCLRSFNDYWPEKERN